MRKILGMIVCLMSSSAFAGNYSAMGCGLGSMVFTDTSSLLHQVLGATTNGTSGNQTFGMTSGTSNCELDETNANASVVYIEANKVALANEIARGEGSTLAGLVKMYGCSSSSEVNSALKSNYSTIFPNAEVSSEHVSTNVQNVLKSQTACI
jgi:hypothetical protein